MAEVAGALPAGLRDEVHDRLAEVIDPCSAASVSPMSIVELGLIREVTLDGGVLTVHLRLTSPSCMMVAYIAKEVTQRLSGLERVRRVDVVPDEGLDWDPGHMDPAKAEERARRLRLLDVLS